MSDAPKPSSVTEFRLTSGEATRRIHAIAKMSEKVSFGKHARERMAERGIVDSQVFEVLRRGQVVETPEISQSGDWKCKIVEALRGSRKVGVVVAFLKNGKLFLVTVEWEDMR